VADARRISELISASQTDSLHGGRKSHLVVACDAVVFTGGLDGLVKSPEDGLTKIERRLTDTLG